jgi:tetratricopeptide (TPR) repeat protein
MFAPKTLAVIVAVSVLCMAGCGRHGRGPYSSTGEQTRDIKRATDCYQKAMACIHKEPSEAEPLLREALGYDLYHGSAHNNLGVLLLQQGRLYDAAEEFEWARKLMPGNPEPRLNLALALDRGGKGVEAVEMALTSLETSPGYLPSIQAVTLIQIRDGVTDDKTRTRLDEIAMRSRDQKWVDWAHIQRTKLDGREQNR